MEENKPCLELHYSQFMCIFKILNGLLQMHLIDLKE